MNLSQIRAADAKEKAAYYRGDTDRHPHGVSGKRYLLPPEDDNRCWDTAPTAWQFSEWGNACGAVE